MDTNMTSRGGQFRRGNSAGTLRDLVRAGVAAGAAALVVAVVVAPVTSNVGVLVSDTTRQNTVVTAAIETSVHSRDFKVRLRPTPLTPTPQASDTLDLVASDPVEGDTAPPPTAEDGAEASLLTVDVLLRPLPAPSAFHPAELLGLPPGPPTPAIATVEIEDRAVPPVVVTTIPKKGSPPALTTTSAPRKSKPMKPAKPANPAKPGKGHNHDKAKPVDRGDPDSANGDGHRDGDEKRGGASPVDDHGSGEAEKSRNEKKNPKAGGPAGGPPEERPDKAATPESSSPGNSEKPAKAKKSDRADPSDEYPADESEPTG